MWEPLLITGLLAATATLISVVLYKRGESHVRNKWARFSGAAAIAIAAYLGMTRFYLELADRQQLYVLRDVERFQEAREQYDVCLGQEPVFACRQPATTLRDVCVELLEPPAAR